ncbi:CaiB/BaiF CoA transferase family protein [Ruegeria arenilitoris]|uniref:CaiB/BaiF CoA transferase family protein n=1 Tax=Ruegeria arenilitoris TaxID=1173585 RepID=UPI001481BA42|nr:CoA transferase [Ruegeria arenilitoris]
MTDPAQSQPLNGLRILDFTRVLAGPYCTALLADIGAEVIKIESASGDDYRHIGPFRGDESLLFQSINRGKKSVVLNLKDPDDLTHLKDVVATSDVVVENFRPGVMQRLGLGYDALSAINPGLVYVSISGFGQTGPDADKPAYDMIVQALSGLMEMTGEPDTPPTMSGEAIGDVAGGIFAAWSMMVALFDRTRTGKGRYIDVSLLDSLMAMMPIVACRTVTAGGDPTRTGNRHALSAPFGVYSCRNGSFALAVLNNQIFQRFLNVIGAPDLIDEPRFSTDENRRANEVELAVHIESWASKLTLREVIDALNAAGVPASELRSAKEAWTSPGTKARQLATPVDHPTLGRLNIFEQPVHFAGLPRGNRHPAPALGANQHDYFPEQPAKEV